MSTVIANLLLSCGIKLIKRDSGVFGMYLNGLHIDCELAVSPSSQAGYDMLVILEPTLLNRIGWALVSPREADAIREFIAPEFKAVANG